MRYYMYSKTVSSGATVDELSLASGPSSAPTARRAGPFARVRCRRWPALSLFLLVASIPLLGCDDVFDERSGRGGFWRDGSRDDGWRGRGFGRHHRHGGQNVDAGAADAGFDAGVTADAGVPPPPNGSSGSGG